MRLAHPRAVLIGLAVAVSALAVNGCGSSSRSSSSGSSRTVRQPGASSSSSASASSSSTGSSPAGADPAQRLEHALRAAHSTPAVTAAGCRLETSAERGRSPFGPTGPPVYACLLTAAGAPAAYDVQVLPTGCFVAERRRPGKAIYGCGAAKG